MSAAPREATSPTWWAWCATRPKASAGLPSRSVDADGFINLFALPLTIKGMLAHEKKIALEKDPEVK